MSCKELSVSGLPRGKLDSKLRIVDAFLGSLLQVAYLVPVSICLFTLLSIFVPGNVILPFRVEILVSLL